LGFQAPSINNGGDEATASNGGLGYGSLGNNLVENETPYIKLLIFYNAQYKKNLSQIGTTLALMSGENGVAIIL